MAKSGSGRKASRSTPLMRQWREAKRSHPDALLLFRMGDFYETFEEDAKIAASVLGIALTRRSNQGRSSTPGPAVDVPLAGFPHHALDTYLHKLLKAGHKVAICEQVEDPKLAKGIVRREVVEVVTPGTALAEKYLEQGSNNYLAGICFYAPEERIGLALLDHSTGEFFLEENHLSNLQDRLLRYQPAEILVPEAHRQELKPYLGRFDGLITPYHDWIADLDNARRELMDHFGTSSLKGFGIEDYSLGISAAGVVIHYIYQNSPGPKPHISSIRALQDDGFLGLDDFTVRNLELFQSLATQGTHGTLISILDHTRTAAGARLLKQWLKAPLQDRQVINERLDRVTELAGDQELCENIRQLLQQSSDLERILGRISTGRASPRDVVALAASLEVIAALRLEIGQHDHPALTRLVNALHPTGDIAQLVRHTLIDEPPMAVSRGNYIRSGCSPALDELRELARSGKDWIAGMQSKERERTGIPSLKVGFNNVFGYYIEVTSTHQDKVPEEYIRKQTLVNAERYITPELKEYEEKVLTAEEKIQSLEKELFEDLQKSILAGARGIQENARILAQVDIATGLAVLAETNEYTRPELVDEPILRLVDSRHPVVETLLPVGERFTPNNLEMDPTRSQIHIITGPNMAGKSTFLRQIGLIVVMAQMGSFVPAREAVIGVVDRVFTRVGASDNLAGGESTFLVEMVETANILHNATLRSLILLDEIGRGTATFDGLSIAWAVTEYLHQNPRLAAKTLFATHYHELVALGEMLLRAENYNVAVREHGHEVVFLRKIVPGGSDRSYGIHVAQMAGLPASVIQRAGEVLATLTERNQDKPEVRVPPPEEPQLGLFTAREQALRKDFKQIDLDNLTPIEALNLLDKLKKKHGL